MSSRRPQSIVSLLAALVALALLGAPAARADVGETIIERCTHGKSLAGFSQSAYRKALKELTADAEEYSPCGPLIRQAQLAAASGGGGASGGSEGAAPLVATPAEQRSLAHAAQTGAAPVALGGKVVRPGVVHANVASAFSSLPSSLLATLALLLVSLVLFGANAARRRIRGNRAD
ncbi:MAG TPA: hypothetical protein VFW29_06895 [Solirubrobacteraceae bacterium]|nr:hypothetical protein [Solirubrobacteraceae bacterium]